MADQVQHFDKEKAQEPSLPVPKPETPQSRVTVVERIYYQSPGGQPTLCAAGFTRLTESEEPPYFRRNLKVGEEWQPIGTGWFTEIGFVVIENQEKLLSVQPTKEERDAMRAQIIEVALGDEHVTFIRPKENFRFDPRSLDKFRIRCLSGQTMYALTVFPG
jgi:hypothetical protein